MLAHRPGQWIGIEALAEYLGVPVSTIRKWRAKGTGPKPRTFGRHLRWHLAEVDEWADQQTDEARKGS